MTEFIFGQPYYEIIVDGIKFAAAADSYPPHLTDVDDKGFIAGSVWANVDTTMWTITKYKLCNVGYSQIRVWEKDPGPDSDWLNDWIREAAYAMAHDPPGTLPPASGGGYG